MKAAAVFVAVAAIAAGCGGAGRPRFEGAAGWHILSRGPQLAAANVPFAAADRSLASPPSRTVAKLKPGGTLIWVQFYPVRQHREAPLGRPLRIADMVASNPPEGFRCPPDAQRDCFSIGDAIRVAEVGRGRWDVGVFVFFGTDHSSPMQIAAADAELARLSFPGSRTPAAPKAPRCRRPTGTGYYRSTLTPSAGPAGTTVTVSGRLPVLNEAGRDVGQTASEVVAYWNLDFDHWTSVFTASPKTAVAGSPVRFLGTESVAGRCTYRVRAKIPSVRPGTYPIEVLSGNAKGGASFAPAKFLVTG